MINLLRANFYKLFRTKSFYVIGLFMAVLAVLNMYMDAIFYVSTVKKLPADVVTGASMPGSNFYDAFLTLMYNYMLYITLFIILFVCAEFANGTIKNIVGKGFFREAIYTSKLIIGFIGLLIYNVVVFLASYITFSIALYSETAKEGLKVTTQFDIPENFTTRFLLLLLYTFVYISLGVMLAMLLKKSGLSILSLFLTFAFLPMVFKLIDVFFKYFVKSNFKASDYLLSTNASLFVFGYTSLPHIQRIILIPIFYIAVTIAAGILYFRKCEV